MRSTNIILPDKLPEVKRPENMCSDTFHINIITPMMGGGVEAGEVNESNPVRISELRGILRFWWRLIHNNNNSLLESESRLWGSTKNKSRVIINVPDILPVKFRSYMKDFDFKRYGNEAYSLFPAAPKRERGQIVEGSGKDIAREGLNFTLRITYPREFQDEIRLTIASLIYFGGVGSRTRRGLGSLSCDNALPSVKEVLGAASSITLWRKRVNHTDALKAWSDILGLYKEYRQQRNSTGDKRHPGRSRWPEPDSIRQITGCSLPRHRRPVNNIIAPVQSFPRAALGLPIIFKFKDDCKHDRIKSDLEPYQTTLKPKDDPEHDRKYNRMSSPVITKAMYDKNILYSAVVILPHSDHNDFFSHGLELAEVPDHVINRPAYDAVSGFEDFISARGFQRVTA